MPPDMTHFPTAFPNSPWAPLKLANFRWFILSVATSGIANRALVVVIGYQIYKITGSALALGWLGFVEAIPALALSLYGGYVADYWNRKKILLITKAASALCATLLAFISLDPHNTSVPLLYLVIFLAGLARGFSDPAHSAFEAQVIPRSQTVSAAAWVGSIFVGASIIGPAMAGFSYEIIGAANAYFIMAALHALSLISIMAIQPQPQIKPTIKENLFESIRIGWRFVLSQQPLIAAMWLDLIAVFFGGAVALLPVFAKDILHVGPSGLGLLNAATAVGALLVMLWSTHHPPVNGAGKKLLWSVAGFGISMIVFAFSTNFYLSLLALMFSGIFDGVSMVIRRSMVRLLTPDHLRGRVSSVSWMFIGASNELGAFESGVAAHFLGTARSVWLGGILTLVVVGVTALKAPQLRRLSLHLPRETRL